MAWSIKIARIAGIDVKLHITFLLFLVWIAIAYYNLGGLVVMIDALILILTLFGCVLLHEFGHALAARSFGIRTPDIILLPIGGAARMVRIPNNPHEELIMAIAGPAVNFLIAAVLVFALNGEISLKYLEHIDQPGYNFVGKIATINIMIALFNLIPAFPMDGGRVLRAVLAMFIDYTKATKFAAGIGQGLAFVFALVGLFFNPMLIFIALFVYLGASQEATVVQVQRFSSDLYVSDAMMTRLITLTKDSTINDAVEALLRSYQRAFPVLDEQGRVLGVLTRDNIIKALENGMYYAYVIDYMQRDLPYAMPYEPFEEAQRKMQEFNYSFLPVVDCNGRYVGLVTLENVADLLLFKSLNPNFRR